MANIKSSQKDIRRTKRRHVRNVEQRTRLRTYSKKILALVQDGKLDEAQTTFRTYARYLDRAGRKNLIHHRQADRRKSRIALLLKKAAGAA